MKAAIFKGVKQMACEEHAEPTIIDGEMPSSAWYAHACADPTCGSTATAARNPTLRPDMRPSAWSSRSATT